MPELPEVETVCRRLAAKIVGKSISHVDVHWTRTIHNYKQRDFVRQLHGAELVGIRRRAKFIVIDLKIGASSAVLMVHLRMSGDLLVRDGNAAKQKHDRVILTLSDGSLLCFNDIRKFGRMYLAPSVEKVAPDLGVEPLAKEFTSDRLAALLQNSKRALKPLLLDQKIIAGIGNIYADECLWRAKIHPKRIAASLNIKEIKKLRTSIYCVLKEAIEKRGTNIGDDIVPEGSYRVRTYARHGKPCLRCKGQIVKIVLAQRGTHFCPKCQRM